MKTLLRNTFIALLAYGSSFANAATTIYEDFFTTITSPLESAITTSSSAIAGAITPTATTLFMIYICFWAWALARGMIQEPILDGVQRIIRWSLIYSIGLVAVHYSTFVINFFWRAPDAMASVVVSAFDSGGVVSGGFNTMNFLDRMFIGYYRYHELWWEAAYRNANSLGIPNLGQIIMAYLIFTIGCITTALAAFFILLAKVAMAVLLGIGPLAIIMLFFESTSKLFDSWLGQLINYMLVGILIAITLAIVGAPLFQEIKSVVINNHLTGGSGGNPTDPDTGVALVILALSFITIFFMFLIPGIASALGGGVALQTLGAVGWVYARARGLARGSAHELSGRGHNDRVMRRVQVARAREWARRNPSAPRRAVNAVGSRVSSMTKRGNSVRKV